MVRNSNGLFYLDMVLVYLIRPIYILTEKPNGFERQKTGVLLCIVLIPNPSMLRLLCSILGHFISSTIY